MKLRSGRTVSENGKRKRTEDEGESAVLPGPSKVPDTGVPPSKRTKKEATTLGRTKTTKPGAGTGKRKRTEDEADSAVLPGHSKLPDTGLPPKKGMKKEATGQTKTTKPDTFDSLYDVGEILGRGSFGSVYKGTRLSDGLQVAIKYIEKTSKHNYAESADGSIVPLEVALMQKMTMSADRNIIHLIEWFDEPYRFVLILEYPQPCTDLEDFIKSNGGSLSVNMAKNLMLQVVTAATACHKKGVFHRDIKPSNIIINTDTLDLRLTDFGCGDWVRNTGYRYFAGTLKYLPPECVTGWSYHAMPSTVWALGILLFKMVYGKYPFKDTFEIKQGFSRIKHRQPDVPSDHKECWDLIRWCLQPDPAQRPNLQQILLHKFFD